MPVPEIEAMGQVAEALERLEPEERSRVVRWAAERYGVTLGKSPTKGREDPLDEVDIDEEDEVGGGRDNPASSGEFEHFADLYAAVDPSTDKERVLVAAYWVQVIEGDDTFGSTVLNKMLKDLGHSVTAINKAMSRNMNEKPQLILQVKRGGNSQQSRKIYKLTAAGVAWVKGQLG